jgi:hypothetical protein
VTAPRRARIASVARAEWPALFAARPGARVDLACRVLPAVLLRRAECAVPDGTVDFGDPSSGGVRAYLERKPAIGALATLSEAGPCRSVA